jgi:ribosomal protein S18 acetylase RimI-like enzyme
MGRDADGLFVAEIGEPVGFIACDTNWFGLGDEAEIHELFVKPEWQRRGVGRALLMHGIEYIKSREKSIVGLWVGVTNSKAINFYRRMGFVKDEIWGRWLRMILKL